jgi:hypothetical protein
MIRQPGGHQSGRGIQHYDIAARGPDAPQHFADDGGVRGGIASENL